MGNSKATQRPLSRTDRGAVRDSRTMRWSGMAGISAVKVADLMRFSPAMNRDQPIRVVVAMPITFRVAN